MGLTLYRAEIENAFQQLNSTFFIYFVKFMSNLINKKGLF
jgi:hypothetical protein